MLIGNVRPTTLEGVKSLAAQLRKEQGVKHSVALDLAAKAANCTNFRNAQKVLPKRGTPLSRSYVLLTRYWYDKEQKHRSGRETLKVELSKPIIEICAKSALKRVRGFGNLRMVAGDHFVCDTVAPSQSYAREQLCTAERSLRFTEYTGLQPASTYSKTRRDHLIADKLPDNDHATYWADPVSGAFILIDEPYGVNDFERATWAAQTGWRVIKTSWPGMYNPHSCDLYVVADGKTSFDLDALVAKINAMPMPLLEADWPGESAPSWGVFASPMAKTAQDIRRARCKGTIYSASSASTVPYHYGPGSSERRPAGKMEIKEHWEAGRIIKAIIRSYQKPFAVNGRMNSVRATLEDWMSLENTREQLQDIEFFDVYYREAEADAPYHEIAKSRVGVVSLLGDLKQKLQAAYPDCAPLRKQLHRIDMSISLIGRMKQTN